MITLPDKRKAVFLIVLSVVAFSALTPTIAAYQREDVITPELSRFFSTFEIDRDGWISWDEAMDFYNWVEQNIKYRYDDENDPDGLKKLEEGTITKEQLGDGREGPEYWQKPLETYTEGYGDCEDMAILELAFYDYWDIESYLGVVDVDGDGVQDHGICIVWFGVEALEELLEEQGVIDYYNFEGRNFVIVDNAYSYSYGFIGKTDPFTGEPFPEEEIDFSLYEDYTLEDIYDMWWVPITITPTPSPTPTVTPTPSPTPTVTPMPSPTKTVTPTPTPTPPGFEAIFAVAGLLAVAYLLRRRN